MQLKDVVPIIRAIVAERNKIPLLINQERYIPNWKPYEHGNAMRGGLRKALRAIEQAPVVDAVEVVRCKDCAHRHTHRCPMAFFDLDGDGSSWIIFRDNSVADGFCQYGMKE